MEYILPSVSAVLSLTALGAVFGLVLSYARQKLKVDRDPRFEKVLEALPGANCGACGQPGCSGYAGKIVNGEVEINLCTAGGAETVDKIAELMGVASMSLKPTVARVNCQGSLEATRTKFTYNGPQSCAAAQQVMGGFKTCRYGCLGLGDCTRVCPFDAIHMDEKLGLPVVDFDKCTGCGKCVTECPRNIIRLVDKKFDVFVICRSLDKAPVMKLACDVGCIACMRCVKACKEVFKDSAEIETAIEVVNFLAVIDYDKCINCGKCAEVCPKNVINPVKVPVEA
jgi:RnfABCDGE-type electron transport complex B subunit